MDAAAPYLVARPLAADVGMEMAQVAQDFGAGVRFYLFRHVPCQFSANGFMECFTEGSTDFCCGRLCGQLSRKLQKLRVWRA